MASPTRSELHVSRPLTNIAVAYVQSDLVNVSDKVFPPVGVQKQADRYLVYPKGDWFKTNAQERAPGTETAGDGYDIDNTPTYFCTVWGLHRDIPDQLRQNADAPIDLERDSSLFLSRSMTLRREKQWMNSFMVPGVWKGLTVTQSGGAITTEDFTPSVTWGMTNSNPPQDVAILSTEMESQTGFKPNTMVVSPNVHAALCQNPVILDRIKYTQFASVTEDILARIFQVDKYLVCRAVENTAQDGQAPVMGYLSGNKFLLTYAAPNPGIMVPTGGYTFNWTGMYGGQQGARVKSFRMEALASDRIEMEMAFDQKLVGPDLGILGINVI
jgi:hypothetical protein